MKLTQEQAQTALDKLQSYGPRPCPYCGSLNGFKFDLTKFDVAPVENIKTVLANGYYDSIPVFVGCCKKCGYVIQFNLRTLGVL